MKTKAKAFIDMAEETRVVDPSTLRRSEVEIVGALSKVMRPMKEIPGTGRPTVFTGDVLGQPMKVTIEPYFPSRFRY